ncbi:histidine phosphatase family protein [Loigolactobacillus jiayinensis]|uniref:Histidine phosphatase family protein n=1 Tax=Loigolactobacillus jiayinensis TaxID=2486016 RepID=A0ABW1RFL6_9LACO|nr:histidine phosphatase family protein [Loigolactobacillus jiayinensis]
MTEFYIVRHGQTQANTQDIKQGTINTPATYLNDTGKAQAQKLHDHFDLKFADRMIASPLERTKQTAAILNVGYDLPLSYDQRLLEISYGRWDGQTNASLRKTYPELFNPITGEVYPDYAIPAKGEEFTAVEARVREFTEDMTQRYPEEKIVIVSHGFTVRSFAINAVQPKDPMSMPEPENTSVTKIICAPDTLQQYLIYYNRRY